MILFCALSLLSLPRYSIKIVPLKASVSEWVEIGGISPKGNVAANIYYGSQFYADDIAPQPTPVLIVGGRAIYPSGAPSMTEAVAVNDKGQGLLQHTFDDEFFVYDHGKLRALPINVPSNQVFYAATIDESGTVGGSLYTREDIQRFISNAQFIDRNLSQVSAASDEGEGTFRWSANQGGDSLRVQGLPELQVGFLRKGPSGVFIGYGIHDDYIADPPATCRRNMRSIDRVLKPSPSKILSRRCLPKQLWKTAAWQTPTERFSLREDTNNIPRFLSFVHKNKK